MIGVTSAEAYILLNNEEMELGLEPESRNKLVSDLVTATYQYHQKEIFSAIITEYTDWANPAKHPVTTRSCGNNLVNTTALTRKEYSEPRRFMIPFFRSEYLANLTF